VGAPLPPEEHITAGFMVAVFQTKIVLVRHQTRGLELPGGHKMLGESSLEAAMRETREEAAAIVDQNTAKYFGYKRVELSEPAQLPEPNPHGFTYPNPSYLAYYAGHASDVLLGQQLSSDVSEVILTTPAEAYRLLAPGHAHDVILRRGLEVLGIA
jgi:8-oxo-dGTP pyrophosphatase MutT (NUDIX family)